MNIRFTLAAVAAVFAASTFVTDTAEAGGRKRVAKAPAAKAAPAPAARSCPLADMLKAKRERMATRMSHVRAAHARPARAAKPVKVAKAAPAPKAPKK
jgi:hypothetical protein